MRFVINTQQTDRENQKEVFICDALSIPTQPENEDMGESLTALLAPLQDVHGDGRQEESARRGVASVIKQPSILDLDSDLLTKLGELSRSRPTSYSSVR